MKHHLIPATLSLALILGSCNIMRQNSTRVSGAEGVSSNAPAAAVPTQNTKPAKAAKTKGKKKNEQKKASAPATIQAPEAEQLAGEWIIVSVNGKTIGERDEMPYLTFDNGRIYGNNGCNVLNGAYTLTGGNITFSNIATTMRYCPDAEFEHEINTALHEGTPVRIAYEQVGHESYISLLSTSGHNMLTARRHNMDFLNGQWRVTSINGQDVDDDECNIFFDIAEGKVHGNTGCNYFNGDIFISPDRSNAIELSNMGVTRMACPKTEQETAMLVALEQVTEAIQGSEGRVMLLGKDSKQLITLTRTKVTEE